MTTKSPKASKFPEPSAWKVFCLSNNGIICCINAFQNPICRSSRDTVKGISTNV